jgi:hypothetical protein
MDSGASPIGIPALIGAGLVLLGCLLWTQRDAGQARLANSVTATAEFATTSEADDARINRAFAAAQLRLDADARLDPIPNQTRVRHTRLTVRAPTETAAIAKARALAEAMDAAFAKEGPGTLTVDVRRRTSPVPNETTVLLAQALRIGAIVLGGLGVVLIGFGILHRRRNAIRISNPRGWAIGAGTVLILAPLLLNESTRLIPLIMAFPSLISGFILTKTLKLRQAATWPSTRARITRSQLQTEHRRPIDDVTKVINVPVVEYEFKLGENTFRGDRIKLSENAGNDPQTTELLDRYPAGTTTLVYYNPRDPREAVLDRDPPVRFVWLYLIVAAILLAGVAVAAAATNLDSIFAALAAHLPEHAVPHAMLFFGLAGAMTLMILWGNARQAAATARWPQTSGQIVSSSAESYRTYAGSGGTSHLVTCYKPVVEYSYEVAGRDYHSTQLSFGGEVAGSQALAEERAARYRAGGQVVVRYDPGNPSVAVIEVGTAYAHLGLLMALIFFGLALFFSGAFR